MKKYLFLTIILLACSMTGFAQNENAAEKRARELVQVLNTGNRAEFRKFVETSFGTRMRGLPIERHLNFFSSTYESSRGFEISGVQDAATPNQVTLLVKNKLTGEWDALRVIVEPQAPNGIDGIGFRLPVPPAGDKKTLSEKEAAQELEAFVKKLAAADVFSGSVLFARNGVVLYKGAVGMANKDFDAPNKIDTKFNLGSMNKMFTAIAIAQLVEKGKISYEDPLSKFLPEFPDKESAEKIKIKHLLSHTAGLGGYFSPKWDQRSRGDLRTIDDMMNLVKGEEKMQFEPGSKWQYSNTGMLVLGKIIELVSGQDYYKYLAENIYKPAGMVSTDCYELDKVNRNLAIGYDKRYSDTGVSFVNNIFMHVMRGGPQGGCYSTAEDLLKFERAVRENKLVTADTIKILGVAKPELNSPNYGYGFQIFPGGKTFGHSGGFPGINSQLDIYRDGGWVTIVMSNYSRGGELVNQKMQRLIESVK